jgi:hypothetical protein
MVTGSNPTRISVLLLANVNMLHTNYYYYYYYYYYCSGTSISRTSRETKKYSSYRKFELLKYIFLLYLPVEFTSGLCPLERKTFKYL